MCAWIPLDIAASAMLDFRNADVMTQTVHLMHPRPVPSHSIFSLMAKSLGVNLVPYDEWLSKIEEKATESVGLPTTLSDAIPALKLLEFFRAGSYCEKQGLDPIGIPLMDNLEAYRVSPALRNAFHTKLGEEDVKLWYEYWANVGFIVDV